jgi:hypothetical protein
MNVEFVFFRNFQEKNTRIVSIEKRAFTKRNIILCTYLKDIKSSQSFKKGIEKWNGHKLFEV